VERHETVRAYLDNQISRRVFIRKMTTAGVSFGAALAYADLLAPRAAGAAEGNAVFYADQVWAYDFYFLPKIEQSRQGDIVPWTFYGSIPHTVTDSSGMHLFDSGYREPGTHFIYEFDAAGAYRYRCVDPSHPPMRGSVRVPVRANPLKGPAGTEFVILWSAAPPPAGFVFDVQIAKPGQQFVDWLSGTTNRKKRFTPARTGRYLFRARLRKLSTNRSSNYSPAAKIDVT
jgi:plastocyanin